MFGGEAAAGRDGEQELVLVAAVQGVAQLDLVAIERGDGDGVLLQDGAGAGGAAEAGEIDGEAVADVDHGRGNLLFARGSGRARAGPGDRSERGRTRRGSGARARRTSARAGRRARPALR